MVAWFSSASYRIYLNMYIINICWVYCEICALLPMQRILLSP